MAAVKSDPPLRAGQVLSCAVPREAGASYGPLSGRGRCRIPPLPLEVGGVPSTHVRASMRPFGEESLGSSCGQSEPKDSAAL